MKIAIEGCCHGQLETIYGSLKLLEEKENIKIDLLICCGDFQAIRNEYDLSCISVPPKYREMGTFFKFFSGLERAPYPTIFIGGNHEAMNYLWELYFGGWVCENVYFMGYSGVIRVNGLRIAGLSGIYKPQDFHLGHFEKNFQDPYEMKSAYHVREFEIFKLSLIKNHINLFLSHDWPSDITRFGREDELLRFKPYFQKDIQDGNLGSHANKELLHLLKPDFWFSAHLHCKFAALVGHANGQTTRFLALDKCGFKRDFLQIIDFPTLEAQEKPIKLEYDDEWLAILKKTRPLMSFTRRPFAFTSKDPLDLCPRSQNYYPSEEELRDMCDKLNRNGYEIPLNFSSNVPVYDPLQPMSEEIWSNLSKHKTQNPQTVQFCDMLEMPMIE